MSSMVAAPDPRVHELNDPSLLRQECLVDGEWIAADDGATLDVINPANGCLVGTVPLLTERETRRAIEAAERARREWRTLLTEERSDLLSRWRSLILENKEDLARIMTLEQGKPLKEALGEVIYGARFVDWFAAEARRAFGDTIPQHQRDSRLVVTKEPVGVVAAITPWNFPNAMITRKCAPALAAGCTLVVKPAEQTPFSALALAALAERAGFPPGVLNMVVGVPERIGAEITSNRFVRKVSFTGSTRVGKLLMERSAGTVKNISLELGGNAPFIVFEDADLDAAVEGAILAKFRNSGQTCVCANRFLVHDSIIDDFTERFAKAAACLRVGPGTEANVDLGPLINESAVAKVEKHISDAVEKGARLVTGGRRHALGGNYFEPTVIAKAELGMIIAREETFGPVAAIFPFATEEQAIAMANDTEYGLAAYFYSRDIGRVWRVSEALEAGMIGVNTGRASTEVAPFGGMKESGIGREGSTCGIDEFLETKFICMCGI